MQFLLCRKGDDFIAVRIEEWVAQYQHGRDGMVSACVEESERLTDPACRRSQSRRLPISQGKLRIEHDAKESGTGEKFMQQPKLF
jgi:hypothetical protein